MIVCKPHYTHACTQRLSIPHTAVLVLLLERSRLIEYDHEWSSKIFFLVCRLFADLAYIPLVVTCLLYSVEYVCGQPVAWSWLLRPANAAATRTKLCGLYSLFYWRPIYVCVSISYMWIVHTFMIFEINIIFLGNKISLKAVFFYNSGFYIDEQFHSGLWSFDGIKMECINFN